ncbi:MAG: F0F1 ATP synthase subunit delta [Polaromonas sp. 39-63-203]|jgi:F-type H+-transporting ATPase subunit delta|uniref:F0F1 ATP synthase subunit delta n=1 Tax=Polaromonas sp. TaxID=1869339 RepID=UPI000BC6E40E|nr:F0F1 ATP synthase subunit delta [Polaromonas sp.]OYY51221.1 MAG: F0F1 ATP synthase subunit delta [Polaromonas sp. 35-63-240]OYZ00536.1 MAG: F0F1 ATP synthase subunit delta [Polaromonas sp. 28-63-22]OYZ83296.1 MAG: F0F1 ATP synthase subunit delta [Polaromonas sp. 24-62-144]OZA95840.1 MAG: F0F1 ATP synthase subunit delta [Polaromonas sp. 39-63-203]HQS33482.1 F0F1 ATP synthase subunit delta [Polaromonas sp.]
MAELATIARPYAEALFKAAGADLAGAAVWLDELAAIASNVQLQQFAGNPGVTSRQTFDVVSGVARTPLPEAAKNFLRAVIDNGRISVLPEIASQFRALKNARSGSSDAVVYSAFPLEPAALADLTATLEKRFGRQLNLRVELEPELIGGVRVVVGDEVLDTSVKARLEQMKVALIA